MDSVDTPIGIEVLYYSTYIRIAIVSTESFENAFVSVLTRARNAETTAD